MASRQKQRAPRNRTITLSSAERRAFSRACLTLSGNATAHQVMNKLIRQDLFAALPHLPSAFVDLLVIDPPYNRTKRYGGTTFNRRSDGDYTGWIESWLPPLLRLLKPHASVYICSDWQSSFSVQAVASKYLIIRNRITWEREKGRGAARNWKNNTEDVWFCTAGETYTFNLDAVRLKRRVLAPYTDGNGKPKDWNREAAGGFRLTMPSNIWTDLTVPFWSMPENTDHPAQKPEKLLAKIILASSNPGDVVFDPFAGSGSTLVTAAKLGRKFCGIELDREYCCLALKRLAFAADDPRIQGYEDGVFWERNSGKPPAKPRT